MYYIVFSILFILLFIIYIILYYYIIILLFKYKYNERSELLFIYFSLREFIKIREFKRV